MKLTRKEKLAIYNAVLTGLLSAVHPSQMQNPVGCASSAIQIADAMIKKLEQKSMIS